MDRSELSVGLKVVYGVGKPWSGCVYLVYIPMKDNRVSVSRRMDGINSFYVNMSELGK